MLRELARIAAATAIAVFTIGVSTHITLGQEVTKTPIGWWDYCKRPAFATDLCAAHEPATVPYDEWVEWMDDTNRYWAKHMTPMDDIDLYGVQERWTYPEESKGDCEDYAIAKAEDLLAMGIPRGALTFVIGERRDTGEGHAVLGVRTDKGIFLLDNITLDIVRMGQGVLRPTKLQSPTDPKKWVAVNYSVDNQTASPY